MKRFDIPKISPATFREIWLPGVHADVGGGYAEDFISLIALLTMAEFLKELADVALIRANYEQVRDTIKRHAYPLSSDNWGKISLDQRDSAPDEERIDAAYLIGIPTFS